LTHSSAEQLRVSKEKELEQDLGVSKFGSKNSEVYLTTLAIMGIAFLSVITFGTIFYKRSKKVENFIIMLELWFTGWGHLNLGGRNVLSPPH